MKKLLLPVIVVAAVLALAAPASADIIFRTDVQITGQGLGSAVTLVTAHDASGGIESGCVSRNTSGTADVFGVPCRMTIAGGDEIANGPGGTRTLADIGATKWGDIIAILNISETGQDLSVNLQDMALQFYGATGNILFTADLALSLVNSIYTQGTGTGLGGAGFTFSLDPTQAAAVNAIGGIVRVGGGFSLTNYDDGNDSLQLTSVTSPNVVPEPASVLLLGGGLASLVIRRRRRG
jgi:PEP-CTERM motif